MSLPVVWLPEAVAEYYEALAWYSKESAHLAARFADAVEGAVVAIAEGPMHFAIVHKDRRRAGIRRFPYGLFFLTDEDRIVVIACFHGKRHPRRWKQR